MSHQVEATEEPGLEVVSISDRNPKVRTVKVARPTPAEAGYLIPTLKGLRITIRHFFRNVLLDAMLSVYEESTIQTPKAWSDTFRKIYRFTDRIQITLLETYEAYQRGSRSNGPA